MRAPKWTTIASKEASQYRINAYRVLLTRARLGNVIFVPTGALDDATRPPIEFDRIYAALLDSGCHKLPEDDTSQR